MKKFFIFFITTIVLAMLAGGGYVGMKLYEKYSEDDARADLYEYLKLTSAEEGAIMFDGAILEEKCRVLNDVCYLDLNTVQKYLHNRFYYTEVNQEIRYTDARAIVTAPLDGSSYSVLSGDTEFFYEEPYTIALILDGSCYIALDFVEKFVPVTHAVFREPDRVVIDTMGLCRNMLEVKKDTVVRWRAGVKSEILTDVSAGDQVLLLDKQGVEDWTKVATKDGYIGYIRNSKLGVESFVTGVNTLDYQEPAFEPTLMDEKIRLGFHAVYHVNANNNLEDMLETAFNINVISPTWFSLSDNEGNFTSIASAEYVEKAHERGIQVWALVEDITNKNELDLYQILADSNNRTHLIEGLMQAVSDYDLDGINIDFENVRSKEGAHFVQFLRELSIKCRANDIVLSVDNYPPNSGNAYNDYKEQGIVVDYVILMGYDEHWGGSHDPGSTSSQPFVERSIDNLLEMVPADRVINALPFYTRRWMTPEKRTSDDEITDKVVIMKDIDKEVSSLGMKIDFDNATGLKYASVNKDGVLHEMWIEDYASIENKLIIMEECDLAGAAAWRLGYENQEIWELIGSYMH